MKSNILFLDLMCKNHGHYRDEYFKLKNAIEDKTDYTYITGPNKDNQLFDAKHIALNWFHFILFILRESIRNNYTEVIYLSGRTTQLVLLSIIFRKKFSFLVHFIPLSNITMHLHAHKIAISCCSRYFVREDFIKQFLQSEYGLKGDKCRILPSGLSIKNGDLYASRQSEVLVILGSTNSDSQLGMLKEFKFENYTNVQFHIVGKEARSLPLFSNITIYDRYITDNELEELYNKCGTSFVFFADNYKGRASKLIYDATEFGHIIFTNYKCSTEFEKEYKGLFIIKNNVQFTSLFNEIGQKHVSINQKQFVENRGPEVVCNVLLSLK